MISLAVPRSRRDLGNELRVALVRILAPDERCHECGERVGAERLEIDHRDGRTWPVRKPSRNQRVRRYWFEFLSGVRLRALCKSCNTADGNRRRSRKEKAS